MISIFRFINVKAVRCNKIFRAVLLLLSCFLIACSQYDIADTTSSNTELSGYLVAFVDPDALKIKSEHALYIAQDKFKGLTVFQNLKENHGLIFIYDEDVNYKFTMKEMTFNIDIIFLNRVLDENGGEFYEIVHIEKNAAAGETGFGSPKSYNAVLEIPANESYTYGLAPGDIMVFTKRSLLGADYLTEDKGSSYVLAEVSDLNSKITAGSEADVRKSYQTAIEILNSREFKNKLLLRLSKQGSHRLATESDIAIQDLSIHEGKNIQVNLIIDGQLSGDAKTACGNASDGRINISITPKILDKGEHYLAGTIAHQLTHHIGNGYDDKQCYTDSDFFTRVLGQLQWLTGYEKIENRNRLTYNVGGLVCEMVAFNQGINDEKCPQE